MKKIFALILAAVMAFACLPAGAKLENQDKGAIGTDISNVNAPYLTAGGGSSTTEFFTIDDISSHTLTLLNIWSENCGYCLAEMPHFQRLHEEVPDILMVGACSQWINGTFAGEWNYFQSQGYTYMNVKQDTVIFNLCRQVVPTGQSLPISFLIDNTGTVVAVAEGALMSWNELCSWVAPVLGQYTDRKCTVTYYENATGSVIETQEVAIGEIPVYPTPPTIEGYSFTGWTPTSLGPMLTDATVTAKYSPRSMRVRFYDSITGEEILRTFVNYGSPVEPPEAPEHEGYTFVGWDHDLTRVTEKIDVNTVYYEGTPIPGDVDLDGMVSASDALVVLRASMELQTLTHAELAMSDINGDGVVDPSDALLILRASMGL